MAKYSQKLGGSNLFSLIQEDSYAIAEICDLVPV